ncbi:EVE domain-containing protein [Niabella hibiscisoli]|uniref:EVE domain-containing protein n=1 Tax=Niabella hibiscisoli TaxID=1825928 RepID=UPI00293F6D1C|nr:EVE domain-containing protein [Niabella hibiscisoli]
MGIAKIVKEAFQDPTTDDDRWVAVEVAPHKKLKNPVTLAQIKAEPALADMDLVRLGRLSTQSVKPEEWELVLKMAGE